MVIRNTDKEMAEAEAELKSRILRLLEEDREFRLSVAGLVGFREVLERLEEHNRRFEEHARMLKGLDLKIEALGSRWGIFSEQAFREGMKSIVEQYFGGEVERWITDDEEGIVFGHPSKVEVDLIVKDGEHILIEIKSSIHKSDVSKLFKEGILYEKVKGVKPKLAIISPFVEPDAKEEAAFHGIPVFTRTSLK